MPELTDSQKEEIKKIGPDLKWNILEITKKVTGDDKVDGRSKIGKQIKSYIIELGEKPKTTKYEKTGFINLSAEDERFIQNNIEKMSSLEVAKILFKKPNISALSLECKTVVEWVKKNMGSQFLKQATPYASDDFKPPTSISRILPLFRRYAQIEWKEDALTEKQQEQCKALIRYLNNYRLPRIVNEYKEEKERDIFLASFISHTYDKPDLTNGEIDMLIDMASERVNIYHIEKREQDLKELWDESVHGEEANIRHGLTEAIDKQINNRDKSLTRCMKIINEVEGSRRDRLQAKAKENEGILSLVEALQKDSHREMLEKQLKIEQRAVEEEIEKIEGLPATMARLMGISKDELLR